jgi:protein-disulfide isomerase
MDRHETRLTVPLQPTDHTQGARDARVVVVEYGDFECPFCREAAPVAKLALKRFEGRVLLVYRHFPVEEAHPHALLAAQAAEAAGGQGKFWQMHDLLFADQAHLKRHALEERAEKLELDMARFRADLDDEVYLQRVREHQQGGNASGIRATPCFFVNGVVCDVSFDVANLLKEVAAKAG